MKTRRYVRHTEQPDGTTYDVVWTDRMTGKQVLRYDGADPANTNSNYGAESDSYVFSKRGLDINEMIEEQYCVIDSPKNFWRPDPEWDE